MCKGYYAISIATQVVNMGIRKRSILTALAIMLIAPPHQHGRRAS
jgi:hypothetical protein